MSDNYTDPSGNTEAFRAFAHPAETDTPAAGGSRVTLLIAAVAAVALVALTAWLALG